jgi:hypothetical protein
MTKYVITLEVELDLNETVDGVSLHTPDRWNYNALLSAGGYHVSTSVAEAYEACCESYVEWVTEDADDRFPTTFAPYFHDEKCVHFVGIEDDEDTEEISDDLLNVIFGDVKKQLDRLTIFPKSEVK